MTDEIVTLKVRTTASFREKLALTAKENNRSMNAEIVARLEKSFESNDLPKEQLVKQMSDLLSRLERLEEKYKEQ